MMKTYQINGGWCKIKNKDLLSPAKADTGTQQKSKQQAGAELGQAKPQLGLEDGV